MGGKIDLAATRLAETRRLNRRWVWLALFAGIGLCLLWVWLGSFPWSGPIIAVDIDQQRVNTPLPAPQGASRIQQSFYPRWDGLREIELLLARQGTAEEGENGRLLLHLLDDSGALVAEQVLATRDVAHNQTFSFQFPPETRSAGRRYLLEISGSGDNPVSPWGYDLDVYAAGALTLAGGPLDPVRPETAAKDLRFVTRYQLTWKDAFTALGTILYHEGALLLLALVFIPLPGVLLLCATNRFRRWDPVAWWGTAFALGVAAWPLLWLGLSLVGGRWERWSLWLCFALGWAGAVFLWRRRRIKTGDAVTRQVDSPVTDLWKHQHLLLLLLLLFALALRLLAVRDILFPPWVDSTRHALITAVMAYQGRPPADYHPFLPVLRFPYHYGFHTLSAGLHMMTNWPLPRLLLFLGQLLNGLLPLTLYSAVWLFTRKRAAGVTAAFLVAVPFFFPAYYATWGRMTQLTAMFLMPLLLALTWLLMQGGRRWRRTWWLVGVLAAGLFLIHLRVFLYYLPFAAVVWLMSLGKPWRFSQDRHDQVSTVSSRNWQVALKFDVQRVLGHRLRRNTRWLAAAAGLALVLVAPRIAQLAAITEPARAFRHTLPNYNTFPFNYVQVGWERQFIALAGAGLLLTLASAAFRRRWTKLPLVLAGWVALLFLLLAGDRLNLPETSLVNLNSMYIILFIPLAIFLAIISDRLWRWLRHSHLLLQLGGYVILGGALAAAVLFGVRQQITILNPQTLLARSADLAALHWANDNLPERATVAVNSWLWLGDTWAGSDGGAWILPLTGRTSTTPPADYVYNTTLFNAVKMFNESATAVQDWSTPAAAEWLRQQAVSHIFVGARGGFFDPAALARNSALEMVYSHDGVFIFALDS